MPNPLTLGDSPHLVDKRIQRINLKDMPTSHYNVKRKEYDASGKVEQRGSLARIGMMKRNAETAMDSANLANSMHGMVNATVMGMPKAAVKVAKVMMTPLSSLGKGAKQAGRWIKSDSGMMKIKGAISDMDMKRRGAVSDRDMKSK